MQAIRTIYKGIKFRSKLEAQWAKFFDSYGIKWCYEPEGFVFSDGTTYLPDFYLTESNCYFEVKGIMNNDDNHKIEMLMSEGEVPVIVGYSNGEFESCDFWPGYDDEPPFTRADREESWLIKCNWCGKYSFIASTGSYACRCNGCYDGDGHFNVVAYGDYNKEWNERATIDYRESKNVQKTKVSSVTNNNQYISLFDLVKEEN